MMKIYSILMALVLSSFCVFIPTFVAADCYSIDRDHDGYGVGDINLKGVDADDSDPAINTSASVLSKYPSLNAFLRHKGYSPTRIFYISAQGDDQTGQVDDPEQPYLNYSKIKKQIRPGDMIIFRGGVYHQKIKHKNIFATDDHPIIFMAYPGEEVIFDNCGTSRNSACFSLTGAMHIVFDGFIFDNLKKGGVANGIYLNGVNKYDWGPVVDVTMRNILDKNLKSGLRGMHNIHNVLIENVVIHDTLSHNIYFGTAYNKLKNSDIKIRDSLLYKAAQKYNGRFCIQHNGLVTGLVLERNICHSNYTGGGFSIVNGSDGAMIRNNLIFNNAKKGIVFYGYKTKSGYGGQFLNNQVLNNTIWVGRYDIKGSETPLHHAGIQLNDSTGHMDILYTNIRNNIIYTQSGPAIGLTQPQFLPVTIIKNNVIFQEVGKEGAKLWTTKKPIKVGKKSYKVEDVESINPLIENNLFANPGFKRAKVGDVQKPEKFNFTLKSGSPAQNFCPVLEAVPVVDDLTGHTRSGNKIEAGCYETH